MAKTCWLLLEGAFAEGALALVSALLLNADLAAAAKPGSALVMLTDNPPGSRSNCNETLPNSLWVTEACTLWAVEPPWAAARASTNRSTKAEASSPGLEAATPKVPVVMFGGPWFVVLAGDCPTPLLVNIVLECRDDEVVAASEAVLCVWFAAAVA